MSTPAHGDLEVYPRVYGESGGAGSAVRRAEGLSPRVRGIRHQLRAVQAPDGSIPACTGNPPAAFSLSVTGRSIPACTGNPVVLGLLPSPPGVYPRVYGESRSCVLPRRRPAGLSPRVRGIRIRWEVMPRIRGSIPACTGNPERGLRMRRPRRVYPRVYGESGRPAVWLGARRGLSPRVRGIRRRTRRRPK